MTHKLLLLFLAPNQGILGMSRQKWYSNTVFWPLEADLVPNAFWNFKAWGQVQARPALSWRGQRNEAV